MEGGLNIISYLNIVVGIVKDCKGAESFFLRVRAILAYPIASKQVPIVSSAVIGPIDDRLRLLADYLLVRCTSKLSIEIFTSLWLDPMNRIDYACTEEQA